MNLKSRKSISIITLFILVSSLLIGCVNDTSYSGEQNIVEATTIADVYLNDDKSIIIDARSEEAYNNGHLKNAINLSPSELVVDKPVPATLAPKAKVERVLSALGITNDTMLYIYDDNNGVSAGRIWWTLRVYGHENVMIVNGGANSLVNLGLELTKDKTVLEKSDYQAREANAAMMIDYDTLASIVEDENSKVKIIDVRSIAEYEAGNIPESVLYPHSNNLYKDGTFMSSRDISLFYSDKGFSKGDEIVLYCKSSFRATQAVALLEEAGFTNLKVYDGAWLEWESMGGPSASQTEKAPITVQDGS